MSKGLEDESALSILRIKFNLQMVLDASQLSYTIIGI